MERRERINLLEASLARQLASIAAAESKLAFVFGIQVAMIGVVAALAPKSAGDWTAAQAIMVSLALALGVATIVCLSFASFPRTRGPESSLLYFGGIGSRTREQYEKEVCSLDDQEYVADLCGQCHRNAEIAHRKYKWIQRAFLGLYLSIIPWGVAVYLLYSS